MPQFAYRLRPTRVAMLESGPSDDEARVVAEHFEYLQDLCRRSQVLFAGRTLDADERAFGIVVLEVGSEAAARELMLADPAVREGVMRAELFAFRVALWAPEGPGGTAARPSSAPTDAGALG